MIPQVITDLRQAQEVGWSYATIGSATLECWIFLTPNIKLEDKVVFFDQGLNDLLI